MTTQHEQAMRLMRQLLESILADRSAYYMHASIRLVLAEVDRLAAPSQTPQEATGWRYTRTDYEQAAKACEQGALDMPDNIEALLRDAAQHAPATTEVKG